jgi:hypothetical protein
MQRMAQQSLRAAAVNMGNLQTDLIRHGYTIHRRLTMCCQGAELPLAAAAVVGAMQCTAAPHYGLGIQSSSSVRGQGSYSGLSWLTSASWKMRMLPHLHQWRHLSHPRPWDLQQQHLRTQAGFAFRWAHSSGSMQPTRIKYCNLEPCKMFPAGSTVSASTLIAMDSAPSNSWQDMLALGLWPLVVLPSD